MKVPGPENVGRDFLLSTEIGKSKERRATPGVRPNEFVWIGINVMQTFTVTDFNHSSNHSYVNYSIGPAVEADTAAAKSPTAN